MAQFDSHKWTREFKEAQVAQASREVDLGEDYSTMRLKSNIAQKWKNTDVMYEDMVNWIESVYIANGVEAVEPIEDALELLLKQGITAAMNTDKAQQGYNDRMRSSLDR